jgi:hypothetical protein
MRLSALVLALCLGGVAVPAFATEWIECSDAEHQASFDFLVGTADVLSISGLTVAAGKKEWASQPVYGPGDLVRVGQAYEDAETLRVDAMDKDFASKIAELRLFKSSEGDGDVIYAGTLHVPGHGAWAVSCDGP